MTKNEVIDKLSLEMSLMLGDLDTRETCKIFLQRALTIGLDHFDRDMEEIIALDFKGNEQGRFKSIREAEKKLGIHNSRISRVINHLAHSAGGYIFIRSDEKELVPIKKTA